LKKLLGHATKYTVVAIFTLYSIGFIIWHSYLGSYGASSVGFLQVEYLAAAFCYLFVLTTLALPPILLMRAITPNSKDKDFRKTSAQTSIYDKGWLLVVGIWYFLYLWLMQVFFPHGEWVSRNGLYCEMLIVVIALLHLVARVCCVVKAGYLGEFMRGSNYRVTEKHIKWRKSRLLTLLNNGKAMSFYLLCILVAMIAFTKAIDRTFVFFTMSLYFFANSNFGVRASTFEIWSAANPILRILLSTAICIICVINVQSFGVRVFGKIPKTVGGGQPENAYLKFSPEYLDVAKSLNIPVAATIGISTNFFGPVGVLLRSDKEVLFLNYEDQKSNYYTTNWTLASITTNLMPGVPTNIPDPSPNIATLHTNFMSTIITNAVTNTSRLTAKQVRADLIDSIIFAP
jgi:hypothetical protein